MGGGRMRSSASSTPQPSSTRHSSRISAGNRSTSKFEGRWRKGAMMTSAGLFPPPPPPAPWSLTWLVPSTCRLSSSLPSTRLAPSAGTGVSWRRRSGSCRPAVCWSWRRWKFSRVESLFSSPSSLLQPLKPLLLSLEEEDDVVEPRVQVPPKLLRADERRRKVTPSPSSHPPPRQLRGGQEVLSTLLCEGRRRICCQRRRTQRTLSS
mmetsp:Transcript_30050/g.96535  ORF Transcript_30050/g.96535 Transcript_30050/m.96535 type:complete len:207 (-) Transcript_30050:1464-2084(-)